MGGGYKANSTVMLGWKKMLSILLENRYTCSMSVICFTVTETHISGHPEYGLYGEKYRLILSS